MREIRTVVSPDLALAMSCSEDIFDGRRWVLFVCGGGNGGLRWSFKRVEGGLESKDGFQNLG
jgi:hypothetical protein